MEGDEPVVLRRDDRSRAPNSAGNPHRAARQGVPRAEVEQLSHPDGARSGKPPAHPGMRARASDEEEAGSQQQQASDRWQNGGDQGLGHGLPIMTR